MYSETCTMSKAAEIVDLAAITVDLLKKLRDETTDKQWDQLCDIEPVDELITALMDLECSIDEG